MKILDTSALPDDLDANEVYWAYNGFDCCLTYEIRDKLRGYLDATSSATYARALDLQAPYLEMMLRGVNINGSHVKQKTGELKKEIETLEAILKRYCVEGIGMPTTFNWRSPLQLKTFFYGILGCTEIRKRNSNGIMAAATDRETLEKLGNLYIIAEPFVKVILALRDAGKALGFLETPLDDDKRIRCSFNLAGTNTGRLSSSFSDRGTGTNLQNVDKALKYIFVPDKKKVFVNIDLEQADSRNVGALCWDMFYESEGPEFAGAYLDACESGDLHTSVCRMAWTDLEWGDDPKGWRKVADEIAYRSLSYRDMAKKLGHGTNYMGQPKTMAMHTKVPQEAIELFQGKYFGAFPCIPAWHKETIRRLQSTGSLTHLFGRRRSFFGRLNDQSVINAAIAYCPQGMTGDEINIGVLNLWQHGAFELLVQVHDSILFQIDEERIDELVPLALELLKAKLILKGGRNFFVPLEAKVGWNWGDEDEKNPYGLRKWKGKETRKFPGYSAPKQFSIRDILK
jgi:DNA polymerase-1